MTRQHAEVAQRKGKSWLANGAVQARRLHAGATRVRLPLGGVASSDPAQVRAPWVRPFWLLAGALAAAIGLFVWVRLALE